MDGELTDIDSQRHTSLAQPVRNGLARGKEQRGQVVGQVVRHSYGHPLDGRVEVTTSASSPSALPHTPQ